MDFDSEIRNAAFNWLLEQKNILGDVLPRKLLEQGFLLRSLGLIPRLLRRELNLVLPSFSQKHPKYPVACCGDFLFDDIYISSIRGKLFILKGCRGFNPRLFRYEL